MKFAQIVSTAAKVLSVAPDQSVMIWGAPGNGKTSAGGEIAKRLNAHFVMFRPSNKDAVDVTGLPSIQKLGCDSEIEVARWAKNEIWHKINEIAEQKPVLLMIDELNQANGQMFNVLNGIFLDRLVGDDLELHPNVRVVASGNRTIDKAASSRMPGHTSNRLMHLDMESDLDGWCEAALTGKFKSGPVQVPVVAFLRFRPSHLNSYDPDKRENCTERTWEMVSKCTVPEAGLTYEEEYGVVAGLIGSGVAAEYMGFKKIMDNMDNPDAILLAPKDYKPSDDPATAYAMMGAMASRTKKDNVDRVWQYVGQYSKEYQVVWLKDALTQCSEVKGTKTFGQIVINLKDVLF